jgi:hypothetical protein
MGSGQKAKGKTQNAKVGSKRQKAKGGEKAKSKRQK